MGSDVNFKSLRWVDALGRQLWPPLCQLCGEPGANGRDLCAACHAELPWLPAACPRCALPLCNGQHPLAGCLPVDAALDGVTATFVYARPIDQLLPRLKFHGGLGCTRTLGDLMLPVFAACARPDALIPIPLHRDRLRQRGYNQAQHLAAPVTDALAIPMRLDILHRRRATQAQSRLAVDARQHNLREAFWVRVRQPLPRHVVLFDDVMTTGATLLAAAHALRVAGVQRVDAWACARVP